MQVEGKKLTLDDIEHDVIRKWYRDPLIHFALHCASVGCPPLAQRAFVGKVLPTQLEDVCQRAVNDPRWVEVTPTELRLSKIFEWYRDDFGKESGALYRFVARYRYTDGESVLTQKRKIVFLDYDWKLNEVR